MARQLYVPARQSLGTGGVFNFSSDTLFIMLVLSSYTFDATHQFASSIGSGNVAVSADTTTGITGKACLILSGVSWSNGVLNFTSPTFTTVTTAQTIKGVAIGKRVGSDMSTLGDDPLICWADDYTGLPLSTNGGNVTYTVDAGAFKQFSL